MPFGKTLIQTYILAPWDKHMSTKNKLKIKTNPHYSTSQKILMKLNKWMLNL